MIVLIMGVSGSGKTTIGKLLATRLAIPFFDADAYHPVMNREKMRTGLPLDDDDRRPWLDALNQLLLELANRNQSAVLACSLLKHSYRVQISDKIPEGILRLVWLDGHREIIRERLSGRVHEFMNAALLDSQIAALEAPADAERIVNDRDLAIVVEQIVERLG